MAETPTPSEHRRFVAPDLLRSIAILWVMLAHTPAKVVPDALQGLRSYGWLGVDLFFVLSGFLIGSQLFGEAARTGGIRLKTFFLRRTLRIFPAFFVVLAVYVWFPQMREVPLMYPAWRFATFTMNFGLTPSAFSQAWSLCVEEHFYIVLPLLFIALHRRIDGRRFVALCVGLLVAGMVLRGAIWLQAIAPAIAATGATKASITTAYFTNLYYPTYVRIDGLLFGVVLAAVRSRRAAAWQRHVPPIVALGGAALALCGALLAFMWRGPLDDLHLPSLFLALPGAVIGYPLFALAIALTLGGLVDLEQRGAPWRLPGVGALATLSYSLYLSHLAAFRIAANLVGDDVTGALRWALDWALALLIAGALWLVVERSFLRLRDRLLRGQHVERVASVT